MSNLPSFDELLNKLGPSKPDTWDQEYQKILTKTQKQHQFELESIPLERMYSEPDTSNNWYVPSHWRSYTKSLVNEENLEKEQAVLIQEKKEYNRLKALSVEHCFYQRMKYDPSFFKQGHQNLSLFLDPQFKNNWKYIELDYAHLFCLNFSFYQNQSYELVDELVLTFSHLLEMLNGFHKNNEALEHAIEKTFIMMDFSSHFFLSQCKLLAIKKIYTRILENYHVNTDKFKPVIIGKNYVREWTVIEPWMNVLRATSGVMAGVLSGCHYFLVQPHLYYYKKSHPEMDLSIRISKNILNVIQYEGIHHLDNPHKGAYLFENVSSLIADIVWDQLFAKKELPRQKVNQLDLIIKSSKNITGINAFIAELDQSVIQNKIDQKKWAKFPNIVQELEQLRLEKEQKGPE